MDYQQEIKEAIELKRKRNFAGALSIFQRLLSQRPKDTYLLSNFGHLYFLMGDYKQALTLIEKAYEIHPLNPFLLNLKVDTLLKLKRIDEAEVILKDLANETDLRAVKKLVNLYISQKRFDEGCLCVKGALSKIGYERDLIISQAEIFIHMGHKDEAAECLKKVILEDPKDEFAYIRLIRLKLEEKSAPEILDELKPLLSIPSKAENANIRALIANAYKEEGRFKEAISEYQTAIKLNPDNLFIRKQLGFCLSKMKDYTGVISIMKECFMADPEDLFVTNTLLSAYRKTTRLNESLDLLSEVIIRYPDKKKLWGIRKKIEKEM